YCPALSEHQIKDLTAYILDQNSKGGAALDPVALARSNVFWVTISVFLLVVVTYLLARYNMRWIDRRAAERRERERRREKIDFELATDPPRPLSPSPHP